jgi:ABC-type sugar transport system permease subunit
MTTADTSGSRESTASGRRSIVPAVLWALRKPQFWFGASIILPTLVWYWMFSFRPILSALRLSVVQYRVLRPEASKFVGLDNFFQLFEHPLFFISVRNTLLWAALAFVFILPLSIFIATCLANVRRGRNTYQALIFVPVVVSLVAVSLLFRMLMDPEVGTFNQILRALHLPESRWLAGSSSALPTIVAVGSWKVLGFYVVILTAGILHIPDELYDAALVDGANEWQRFWRITLPLLGHTLLLVMVLLAIGTLQEFTFPFVMTRGGPGDATYVYNMLIYSEAFEDLRFGTATAAALLQFVLILFISLVQIRLLRPRWSY